MAWVMFTTRAAFDAWHTMKKAQHGIPHPGKNAATGEPDIMAVWTNAYCDPWLAQGVTRVFADVPPEDVIADGLSEVQMIENLDGTMTVVVGAQSRLLIPATDDTHREPKPPRVRVEGVEYDTTTGRPV